MADPDYFTLAELRAMPDLSSTSDYPNALLEAAAASLTAVIEREVGTSFIARTVTAELHDGGRAEILLKQPHARAVSACTEDAVNILTSVQLHNGVLRKLAGSSLGWFATGLNNISVTYTYGYSATVPSDVKQIALRGTRAHILENASNSAYHERRTSINTDMGVLTFSTAGADRPTGYPEVDAMILGWQRRLDVHGFA